ncbi:S41 family peptidase [Fodinicola feengrottensis]|uniref:Tail specific protease domain-containing protein n=1 Tax=Fodinicola feengrottensis TaxID=435914 RepID=A0ABN2H399_9ACTN|nr:S41 family peptidase [Fodinicola feengrottensis]
MVRFSRWRRRLLGAFAHGKGWSFCCYSADHCVPNRTDNSVPLLDLPLAVLTDRSCASACDAFSAAVKDLKLGTLIGSRTAGTPRWRRR